MRIRVLKLSLCVDHWTNAMQTVCNYFGCYLQLVIPQNVIDGGQAGVQASYEHTYVCEGWYANDWHPGKFWRDHCLIEYAGGGASVDPGNTKFAVQ